MDVFDQAMAIEQQGEFLYRGFAREASDEGTVYIFSWLADQEKKHYALFQGMKKAGGASVGNAPDLKGIRGIFVNWKDTRARLHIKPSQAELYRQALDVEEKSIRLYEDAAAAADNDAVKAAFLRVAAEEEKEHRRIMENIVEFVSKPETWAENAEFGYRGEDYYL